MNDTIKFSDITAMINQLMRDMEADSQDFGVSDLDSGRAAIGELKARLYWLKDKGE